MTSIHHPQNYSALIGPIVAVVLSRVSPTSILVLDKPVQCDNAARMAASMVRAVLHLQAQQALKLKEDVSGGIGGGQHTTIAILCHLTSGGSNTPTLRVSLFVSVVVCCIQPWCGIDDCWPMAMRQSHRLPPPLCLPRDSEGWSMIGPCQLTV
jgi:hypothetical protein